MSLFTNISKARVFTKAVHCTSIAYFKLRVESFSTLLNILPDQFVRTLRKEKEEMGQRKRMMETRKREKDRQTNSQTDTQRV